MLLLFLPVASCHMYHPPPCALHSVVHLLQGQQREQKRKQMTIADKAMYSVGSLVYQSAAARLLAFTYIVILHMLVFGSLTHMTHRSSSHIMDHHELLLQHRHDLTSLMHHDGSAGNGAAAAAARVASTALADAAGVAANGAKALLHNNRSSSSQSHLGGG